jgi:hypothetical protein
LVNPLDNGVVVVQVFLMVVPLEIWVITLFFLYHILENLLVQTHLQVSTRCQLVCALAYLARWQILVDATPDLARQLTLSHHL